MRFIGRGVAGLLLLLTTLALLAAAAWAVADALRERAADAPPGAPPEERRFTANVMLVTPGPVAPRLTAYGEVRARRTLELRSPQAGTVAWLAPGFEDGAAVAAGQEIMRLDPAPALAARDLARSDLARAEAEAAEAGRALAIARDELAGAQAQAALRAQALERQRDLAARGSGSAQAVEEAALAASGADQAVLASRAALSRAETQVDLSTTAAARQRITLAEAERTLADTVLRAEFDGLLGEVAVVEGGIVGGGERLASLIDPASLEVAFRLPLSQFSRLLGRDGRLAPLPVTATLDAGGGGAEARGTLDRVGASVGEGQTGRLVYATLAGTPPFRPGDFVTVALEEPVVENAALLPASALGAGDQVLALGEDDRLEAVPVTLLRRQGDAVVIAAAPLAGREVVTDRSPLLGAGIRIRPVRADDAAQAATAPAKPGG